MRKIYYVFALFLLVGCGDSLNLPDINTETDLFKIPLPESDENLIEVQYKPETEPMIHCGGLHTEEDFARIKRHYLTDEPWMSGWETFTNSDFTGLGHNFNPQEVIRRGGTGSQNYLVASKDAAAAYRLAVRWKIEGDDRYAQHAIEGLNAWAAKCKQVTGDTNQSLAAGLNGYQFALAGELLRDYPGWNAEDFNAFQQWMIDVFYSANEYFMTRRHGTNPGHYWANWPLCNIASIMAIGIFTDQRSLYNEALKYLQTGEMNGRITHAIYHVFDGEYANLAQWQETGRDQGHTLMGIGLMGLIFQMAYNQGDDLFAYKDNLFLKACEYAARYNYAGLDCPYVTYVRAYRDPWGGVAYETYAAIGEGGRGNTMPIWALPYNHYAKIKKLAGEKIKYTKMACDVNAPESGGQNSDNSGGFDVIGYGTLFYTLENEN